MTPGARLQAAIEILEGLEKTAQPADGYLRDWFRSRRYAGVKDRAAVSERVYAVLRHRASLAWRIGSDAPRALVLASVAANSDTEEINRLFSGEGHAPAPLTAEELRGLASPPADAPPAHVRGDYPAWLESELTRTFGADLPDEMRALNARASVDLRVNTLRAARDDMLTGLRSLDVDAHRTPYSPYGIRIASGERLGALQHTQFFESGAFEFQDEASQLVTQLCAVRAGQRVLDLAAGAGGKSLALAALMRNQGEILAFDVDARRLKQLAPRARRGGATMITSTTGRGGPVWGNGRFDLVLVDAPCSGSGTWRRNPELKWRLTPGRLQELMALQSELIAEGARHTKPGGRLVYATCSLLTCENDDICSSFLQSNPQFRILSAADEWNEIALPDPPKGLGEYFCASPYRTATDGLFACIMAKAVD